MKHHAQKHHSTKKAPSIEITAQDFYQHHRNQFWYIGIGLLIAALVYVSLVFKDYLTAAVVLVAGLAVFRLANLKPGHRKVKLTEKGIYWGDRFFGYHQLKAFWVTTVNDRLTIYLERLNLATPISFVISGPEAERVVNYLTEQLPWHEHRGEPLPERLGRLLRF